MMAFVLLLFTACRDVRVLRVPLVAVMAAQKKKDNRVIISILGTVRTAKEVVPLQRK
jgi:hypothetical protein